MTKPTKLFPQSSAAMACKRCHENTALGCVGSGGVGCRMQSLEVVGDDAGL